MKWFDIPNISEGGTLWSRKVKVSRDLMGEGWMDATSDAFPPRCTSCIPISYVFLGVEFTRVCVSSGAGTRRTGHPHLCWSAIAQPHFYDLSFNIRKKDGGGGGGGGKSNQGDAIPWPRQVWSKQGRWIWERLPSCQQANNALRCNFVHKRK